MASMITPNVDCRAVCLYRLLRTVKTRASRLISMTMRMPWRSDSSRRSAMPSSFRSDTSSAIFATSVALFTAYGSSSMMMRSRPLGACSNVWRARTTIRPCPVAYAALMPAVPMINPPVGKSGPLTNESRSSPVASGFSMRCFTPLVISRRLCGGMFVVMPTAMPVAPLTSRFGSRAGRTSGCSSVPS